MNSLKQLICLAVVTIAILGQVSHAQNSPQDYVDAHNTARAAVGKLLFQTSLIVLLSSFFKYRKFKLNDEYFHGKTPLVKGDFNQTTYMKSIQELQFQTSLS